MQLAPGTAAVRAFLVVGQEQVQELTVRRTAASDTCRIGLAQATDTLAARPHADIVVTNGASAMPVAKLRPRTLASAITRDGDALRFTDLAPLPDIVATVYHTRAPWRLPLELPVVSEQVVLPAAYIDSGPLLVSLTCRISEWEPNEIPHWPTNYVTIGGDGYVADGSDQETALSRYLAGGAPAPASAPASWLWTCVRLAEELVPSYLVERLNRDLGELLAGDLADSLKALLDLRWDADEATCAIVATGLAARTGPSNDPCLARQLWTSMPAAACVLHGSLDDERARDAARSSCGDIAAQLWAAGSDPYPGIGCFDDSARRLSHLPPGKIDVLWSAARVVPAGLLDPDSRATAARRLFDRATAGAGNRRLEQTAIIQLHGILRVVAEASPRHAEQIEARMPRGEYHPWQLLPALSAANAALARLAARGNPRCIDLDLRLRRSFAELTNIAPQLIATDLVVAELLLAYPPS